MMQFARTCRPAQQDCWPLNGWAAFVSIAFVALIAIVAAPAIHCEATEPVAQAQLRERAQRSLTLIERSAAEYLVQRECFSCHHQAMAILTCMEARTRGLAVDYENLNRQVNRTIEHLRRGEDQYKLGQGQGGKVDTAGYALLGLAAAGWSPDRTTDAVTEYLLKAYADKGHWICSSDRPPTETTDITTSTLALKGLNAFARSEHSQRAQKRVDAYRDWLAAHPPKDNEERVFGLLAAQVLDNAGELSQLRDAILAAQREDGGWSQTTELASDAYATGTSLYALAQAGVDASTAPYQRGLRYLIDTQLTDGSWHVVTRSKPIQKYFESGFPHGADQFISMAATNWATLAMLLALPPDDSHLAKLPELPWKMAKKPTDASVAAGAAQPSTPVAAAADIEFFERDIRPLLVGKCADCHGAEKQSADLRVDSLSALLSGGESGPAIVPRAAERSLMIRAVRREGELKMPPDEPLSEIEISKLQHWIELGAPWPAGDTPPAGAGASKAKQHWAFQPVAEPEVPEVREVSWANNAIDRFVLHRMEQQDIAPAPMASPRELLRRVHYDLVGLPPSAEDHDAFAADVRADAYERVVDRLLASPRFGEQWGRHWLDVARYSDTKGYVYAREERFFVHAAAYRDWVINALVDDVPFDRFVLVQLAADQVAADDVNVQAAMGFLTVGRRFLGVTHDIIDDRIDVVTRGLLGLTVACARCHDHKFDAIPTEDYYSLYGVFHNSIEQRVRLTSATHTATAASGGTNHQTTNLKNSDDFEAELRKRQQQYSERLVAERGIAAGRVRARITDYLLAQLELEKFPAEGFDIIIAEDDLVPAHVRRFQAYLIEAAERNDAIFAAWRRYQEFALPHEERQGQKESSGTHRKFDRAAAAEVTTQLARLPADRLNRLVLEQFSTPPESMHEVATRYGALFARLKDRDKELGSRDDTASRALAELLKFWEGPTSPCEVPDEQIVSVEQYFDSKTCEALWKLQGEIDRWVIQSNDSPAFATVLVDRQEIREPHVFRRGNPRLVGDRVTRQFLSPLRSSPAMANSDSQAAPHSPATPESFNVEPFQHGSGRRELAQAIINPRNPLTTRVWTNRLWQHLFGQGLVSTPSDFGVRAEAPSHPELLDWLASDFVLHQQSTKQAIRQIVLSSSYRQSSVVALDNPSKARAIELDPANRLLWHSVPKRLSFEQQRDTWLMIAQQLDSARGGRARPLFDDGDNHKRTIYGLVDRQFLPGVLRVFDFANPDLHTPQRSQTTVPQQALFELNHEFVADMARGAARATAEVNAEVNAEHTSQARIERLFRLVLGRRPNSSELGDARDFLEQSQDDQPKTRVETLAWQYGYAKFDPVAGTHQGFTPLPHFNGSAWQGGAKWPDAKLGWVQLTAQGGHAGNDLNHAAVRRWTATGDVTLLVHSKAVHNVAAGDGIRCSVVSSRGGLLASSVVHNGSADFNLAAHTVKSGDTIDFVVDFNANLNSDQFQWPVELSLLDASSAQRREWNSERDFSGPQPRLLDRWEQLAQVLLLSNELMFVD